MPPSFSLPRFAMMPKRPITKIKSPIGIADVIGTRKKTNTNTEVATPHAAQMAVQIAWKCKCQNATIFW